MKKILLKLCAFVLVLAMILPGAAVFADDTATPSFSWAKDPEKTYDNYEGKTVILHTNDVHGQLDGYTYVKGLKNYYESMGAEVITVDAGDFSQGSPYVSINKGKNAVTMMNAAGYDIVTLGNHEFDYGYAQLRKNLKKANFKVLCADVFKSNGKTIYDANYVWTSTKSDLKIGFFGLETPEAQTKANPALIQGLTFAQGEELYKVAQKQADKLNKKTDLVICLAHLGVDKESEPNTSYDLYKNTTGIDLIIDGHSHTVMIEGPNGEPIQSTGTKFQYVGMVMIDNATKEIVQKELITANRLNGFDETIDKKAAKIINKIDKKYGTVFAKSEVDLNGNRNPGNRTEETNWGDLITDAMKWYILENAKDMVTVDEDHIIALTNGGGIRASVPAGDITYKDILTVYPFGNSVAIVYVTGQELLEALEISTSACPNELGGFPQVSGIQFTVNTKKAYKNGEPYGTYFRPAKIKRVTINNINGKEFNKNDIYAVITNNFTASGGDTYFAFKNASAQMDTGILLDEACVEYITTALGGVVGSEYAKPQGRIKIKK